MTENKYKGANTKKKRTNYNKEIVAKCKENMPDQLQRRYNDPITRKK
jgi:hypothetical protein